MTDELYHHGILGQKWGVRRYQNADGSLTEAGRKKYGKGTSKSSKKKTSAVKKFSTKVKRKAALEKARRTRAENARKKAELEKNKAEWAKSARSLREHADAFTNEELTAATTRLQLISNIKDLEMKSVERGQKYVKALGDVGKTAGTLVGAATAFKKAYDQFNTGDSKAKSDSKSEKQSNNGQSKNNSSDYVNLMDAIKAATEKEQSRRANGIFDAHEDGEMNRFVFNQLMKDNENLMKEKYSDVEKAVKRLGMDVNDIVVKKPKE